MKWLRDQKDDAAWQELADVVTELYELSRFQVSMQIWWVARAYLDILKDVELGRDDVPERDHQHVLGPASRMIVQADVQPTAPAHGAVTLEVSAAE